MVVLNTIYNNQELDYIFKKINALEIIETYKSCEIIWDKLNPWTYHTTKVYKDSYWDITLAIDFERIILSMEFRQDGFHYVTLDSDTYDYLWIFWNEIEDYDNFYKDKQLLDAIHNFRGVTDYRIYDIFPESAGLSAGGTGLGDQVPYPPSNLTITRSSWWDSDIEEPIAIAGNYSYLRVFWNHSFAYKYYNSKVTGYQLQQSDDGVNFTDTIRWSSYSKETSWNSISDDYLNGKIEIPFNNPYVTRLTPAHGYMFRVRSFNNLGVSDWVYSDMKCTHPMAPPWVFAQLTDEPSTVNISWGENNGNCALGIENRVIKYYIDGVSQGYIGIADPVTTTSVEITGLLQSGVYEFKVALVLNGVMGPFKKSNTVTI